MTKAAMVQMDVKFGEIRHNADIVCKHLESLAKQGVNFAVFPECALTGYCTASKEEAIAISIPKDHAALRQIEDTAKRLGITSIVGFAEIEDGHIFNSAAVFDPAFQPRYYRKTHLPFMGFDRFAEPGHELEVFETSIGRVGVVICFDLRIPEATRTLALKGMQILAVPTNWPEGAQISAKHIAPARAAENRIYVCACNRFGEERGFKFLGMGGIYDLTGELLAGGDLPIAEFDPTLADSKQNVTIPGEYETNTYTTRQPHLYSCGNG